MRDVLRRFARDTNGATSIEYGLIAALLAISIITALEVLQVETAQSFTTVSAELVKGRQP